MKTVHLNQIISKEEAREIKLQIGKDPMNKSMERMNKNIFLNLIKDQKIKQKVEGYDFIVF